jgi:hypothetical protein
MCLRALNLQRPFLYANRRSPDYDDASSPGSHLRGRFPGIRNAPIGANANLYGYGRK